jgi:hypothetical protein
MWEPLCLTTLWASTACYKDSFTFLRFFTIYSISLWKYPGHRTGDWFRTRTNKCHDVTQSWTGFPCIADMSAHVSSLVNLLCTDVPYVWFVLGKLLLLFLVPTTQFRCHGYGKAVWILHTIVIYLRHLLQTKSLVTNCEVVLSDRLEMY